MVGIAAGVGLVWARRDEVLVVAAAPAVLDAVAVAVVLLGVAVAPGVLVPAGLGWVVFAGVAVLLPVAVFATGAFMLVPSSALPVSLTVASACACSPADA